MERSFSIDINNPEKKSSHYLPDKAGQLNALLKERRVLQVCFGHDLRRFILFKFVVRRFFYNVHRQEFPVRLDV